MLKKIYKKDGKIIIHNTDFIQEIPFYYFLIENIQQITRLDELKKKYYRLQGYIYSLI